MLERFNLRDEHGRISGYVLRETPHHATFFRSGPQATGSESPLAVALCFLIGIVTLVASLAYLWATAAG